MLCIVSVMCHTADESKLFFIKVNQLGTGSLFKPRASLLCILKIFCFLMTIAKHLDKNCVKVNLTSLPYCSFVCTGGSFLIIVQQAKSSGVLDFINSVAMCLARLFEIWLSDGVHLKIATEFI